MSIEIVSSLELVDGFRRRASHRQVATGKGRRLDVVVPAASSALAVLDDRVYDGSTNVAKVVRMASSIEGVTWWIIDSATPNIGAGTRPFGPIFNWQAGTYSHTHGAASSTIVNHASTGVQAFHANSFPVFQNYAEDVASPLAGHAVFSLPKAGPASDVRIHHGGYVQDMSSNQSGGQNTRQIFYMVGPSDYYDLGEDRDGLGFIVLAYVEDIVKTNSSPTLQCHSYPFIAGLLDRDLIPATTPAGDATYGTNDRNLCRHNSVGGNDVGFDTAATSYLGSASLYLTATSVVVPAPPLVNGYQSLWYPKTGFDKRASGSNAPVAGDPTWRRITAFEMQWNGVAGQASSKAYIIQMFFAPKPGFSDELRPFGLFTSDATNPAWASSSLPAIGFYNPSSLDAVVGVEFGAAS